VHDPEGKVKMAKRTSEQTLHRPNGNLRVRWVEVELNGSDTTIEEALRKQEISG
jgi:hypothetical protein